ncbi:MAG: HI0074 family nucleotidyltransferase substrate-binding subunit [Candidatus Electryonea clarkiae]|nr:HI0074 family nucleotidyltransferase substrate-binding subunit [Candidatus Electryonea clarkiae]MDP8285936.1 HI0074 family nucleotidyltransferase substrate-binding subunit [Candidatus Electryonea clarkiae]
MSLSNLDPQKLENLRNALDRLHEALDYPDGTPLREDAAIHRFKISCESAWKSLRAYLSGESKDKISSPRNVLKTAFSYQLIDGEDTWLSMLNDRNLMSYIYDEDHAKKIFDQLPRYVLEIEKLYDNLKQ